MYLHLPEFNSPVFEVTLLLKPSWVRLQEGKNWKKPLITSVVPVILQGRGRASLTILPRLPLGSSRRWRCAKPRTKILISGSLLDCLLHEELMRAKPLSQGCVMAVNALSAACASHSSRGGAPSCPCVVFGFCLVDLLPCIKQLVTCLFCACS